MCEVYAYLISVGIISALVLYFSINFLFVLSEIKVHFVSLFAEFVVCKCGATKNGNLALVTTTYNYFIWDVRKVVCRNGGDR